MRIKIKCIKNGIVTLVRNSKEYKLPLKHSISHQNYVELKGERITINMSNDIWR